MSKKPFTLTIQDISAAALSNEEVQLSELPYTKGECHLIAAALMATATAYLTEAHGQHWQKALQNLTATAQGITEQALADLHKEPKEN